MKRILFTKHAKDMMWERTIDRGHVEFVLSRPTAIIRRQDSRNEARRKLRDETITVIYEESKDLIRVITVFRE